MIEGIPVPLLRLKTLIWVHSALGALLLLGVPTVAMLSGHQELAPGALPCLALWGVGYGALRRKAEELAPQDRFALNILPLWVPPLVAAGSFLSPLWFASPFGGGVAASWALLSVTIAIQWGISKSLGIPVHRKAWAGMLVALSLPFVFALLIGLLLLGSSGC